MGLRPSARVGAVGAAVLLALALLVAGQQITPSGMNSAAPGFRAQVHAFLDGRLALTDAPEGTFHDYAWVDGGVQQVWGLGVPAWQTPFSLVGLPDRIPMLAWLALMFYVLIRAWWRRSDEPWWIGAGAIVITALLPAFVTLVRGRVGIYEETAIYAYAAALMLSGGLVRLFTKPSRARLLVLCAAAGLVAFIRPTAAVYGVATFVVAAAWWLQQRGSRGLVEVAIGGALLTAGGGALYATNAARFGDGFEFGHKLNLQSLPGNLYATRFSYPMQRASIGEAALELGASLFDRPEKRARGSFYQKHLHHGVSKRPRWREYYFTTFNWAYVPVLLAGLVLGGLAWRRRANENTDGTRWLFAWAVLALVPLLAFYLRAPFVSSRYQIDLAPAFAVLVVIAWRAFALRLQTRPWIPIGVLAIAWIACIAIARTAEPRSADPVDGETAARLAAPIIEAKKHPRTLPGVYDLNDPWLPVHTDLIDTFERCTADRCLHGTRAKDSEQWTVTEKVPGKPDVVHVPPPTLYLNLYRWNLETGQMPPATFAFVDDPAFIEIEIYTVEGPQPSNWADEVNVAVGLVHLRLVSTTPTERGMKLLRFEAPNLPRGLQVAYFAFGVDDDLAKPMSRIAVRRIRWH